MTPRVSILWSARTGDHAFRFAATEIKTPHERRQVGGGSSACARSVETGRADFLRQIRTSGTAQAWRRPGRGITLKVGQWKPRALLRIDFLAPTD